MLDTPFKRERVHGAARMLDTPMTEGSLIPTRFSSHRTTFRRSTLAALPHSRSAPAFFSALIAASTSLEYSYFSEGGALRSALAASSSWLKDWPSAGVADALQQSRLACLHGRHLVKGRAVGARSDAVVPRAPARCTDGVRMTGPMLTPVLARYKYTRREQGASYTNSFDEICSVCNSADLKFV